MTRGVVNSSARETKPLSDESADSPANAVVSDAPADYEARVFLIHLESYSANFGQTLALAVGLRAENWDARIVCRASCSLASTAAALGVPVHSLPDEGGSGLVMAWRLLRAMRDKKNPPVGPFLAHACDPAASQLVSLAWRLRKKFRIVHTRRVPVMEGNAKAIRCYRVPQAKVITDSLAGKIALRLSGLEPHMLRTIACGLDAAPCPRRNAVAESRFVYAVTGDLTPENGHAQLFDALPGLERAGGMPPWEVRILGDGPHFPALLETAQAKNVARHLAFLTGLHVAAELARCNALVLPAAEGESYLPLILQGWATGLPVITINRLDHAEILQNEGNCLLAQPGDPNDLAAQMIRIANDPLLRDRLVEGGTASLKQFSLQTMVAEHRRLYREILA